VYYYNISVLDTHVAFVAVAWPIAVSVTLVSTTAAALCGLEQRLSCLAWLSLTP